MKFVQRMNQPSSTDKNWLRPRVGGYNKCIEIKNGSVLKNCVGYAWGRWRELLGEDHKLYLGNAETWYGHDEDGYKRGQTPKLGAVICYASGQVGAASDGAGHVAIVEEIHEDGSITISESNYTGVYWRRVDLPKGYAYAGTKLRFLGFIYPPIEFEAETTEKKTQEPSFVVGKNYVMKYTCYVRTGAGQSYRALKKKELTRNAQQNATLAGCLKAGSYVTCQKVDKDSKGNIWIKIPSGWIAAYFNGVNYLK